MIATTDEAVIVWGGFAIENNAKHHLDDGATFSSESQQWSTLPAAPFGQGLFQAGAVMVGSDLIIVGTPCGDVAPDDGESASCGDNGLAAAAYSLADSEWRALELPTELTGAGAAHASVAHGLGSAGNAALFSLSIEGETSYVRIDLTSGSWQPISPPPTAEQICAADETLFAVSSGRPASGNLVLPADPTDPKETKLQTWRFEPSSNRWTELPTFDVAPQVGIPGSVTCGVETIAFQVPGNDGIDVVWFEPTSGQWTLLPRAELERYDSGLSIAQVGETELLWPTSYGATQLFARTSGDDGWTPLPKPQANEAPVVLLPFGSQLLVQEPIPRAGPNDNPPVQLALFDVAAPVAAA